MNPAEIPTSEQPDASAGPDAPRGLGALSGGAIAVAFATASGLGFVLLGVLPRWLSQEQYAQFLALWGLVFGIGGALSAVEQEIVRIATNAHIDGVKVSGRALQVVGIAIAVAVLFVAVIAVAPGVGQLLRDSLLVCVAVFVATGGFAVQCLSRAVLLGTNQVGAYIRVVVGEAALRLALAALFIVGGAAPSLGLAVLTIVIGCFGWLPVIGRVAGRMTTDVDGSTLRSAGATVGALGLANGLQSVQVTGFPAVASAVLGASAVMAPVYGGVTLARLPLVALAPVQALAVPLATRMIRTGQIGRLIALVARLSLGGLACAVIALVAGWFLGPWALLLYLGPGYVIAPLVIAVLLAASCILAVALLEVAALIALERYWTAAAVWLAAAAAVVATLMLAPLPPDERVAAAVAAGALVSWAVATASVTREARRRQRVEASA